MFPGEERVNEPRPAQRSRAFAAVIRGATRYALAAGYL